MENSTAIEKLLIYIENGQFKLAYEIRSDARSEFDHVYKHIKLDYRSKIGYLNEFIKNVEDRREKSAAAKRQGARIAFNSYIRPFLEAEQRGERLIPRVPKPSPQKKEISAHPQNTEDKRTLQDLKQQLTKQQEENGLKDIKLRQLQKKLDDKEQSFLTIQKQIKEFEKQVDNLKRKLEHDHHQHACDQEQVQQLQLQLTKERSKEQDNQRQHARNRNQIKLLQERLTLESSAEQEPQRQLTCDQKQIQNNPDDIQERDYSGSQSLMSDEIKEIDMKASQQKLNTSNIGTPLAENDSPTSIAKRFVNLYDKEWNQVFEELNETMKSEKTTAAVLLEIVQKAYRSNFDESIRQINGVAQLIKDFVRTGKADYSQHDKQQTSAQDAYEFGSLVQYRKEVAEHAVERLIKEFLRKHDVAGKYKPKTRAFAEKCVDVTWWMCVQDPPIYMVDGKDSTVFPTELYRPFTKSGKRMDFVVWPALQLYKDGPVLAKGVAQGK